MRILEVKTGGRPVQMAPIALGAQPMGSTMPEETAFACLDAFCQWGESRGAPVCVDTARVYSSWIPGGDGTSERTIGRWLSRIVNREKVVLSTKGGHPAEPGLPRLDRESLRRDLAESLAHLNTDHVELYFLHRDDPRRPVGEILESLNEWVESGAVRALGASNWRASRIEEANRYAASHGLQGFTVSQIQWSLARTSPDKLGDPTRGKFPPDGTGQDHLRPPRGHARRGMSGRHHGKSAPRLRHRGLFLPGAAAGHPVGRLAGALAGGGGLAVGRLRGQSPGSITG